MSEKALILVVEDESGILTSLELLLELEGYRVMTAADGGQAWRLLQETIPDLVITDLFMPFVDGGELIARMKANDFSRDIPIILTTSVAPESMNLRGRPDAYCRKPFHFDDLLAAVASLLN